MTGRRDAAGRGYRRNGAGRHRGSTCTATRRHDVPFAHCIDCGTSALIDPSGRCPEGHEVGAAGARVASAIGSAGPHPDEPLPWVGTVELDPAVLDAAPPEPRVARPPSVPTNDETAGVPAAPGAPAAGATDELLRELHALGDFGDFGDVAGPRIGADADHAPGPRSGRGGVTRTAELTGGGDRPRRAGQPGRGDRFARRP
jgi:hypothetical protein